MKDKIFGVLQRVGRSFMLPIAILPVAGLLLGFGSSFTNATTIQTYGLEKILGDGTILNSLLIIMNKVGSAVFDNLPLIFAVGVAIGMAKKEKEVAALSALIAFFVMNVAINAMLVITGEIACMMTGITEPLEFSFLFVAPALFAVQVVLAGSAYMIAHILNIAVGLTFSGGFLDLFLFGILQVNAKTSWLRIIPVGIIYFFLY